MHFANVSKKKEYSKIQIFVLYLPALLTIRYHW